MCGILVTSKNIPIFTAQLALQKQAHRGPNNVDSWHNEQVFLGHNRLSIIDLSNAASQPMFDASKRFCIVFNGEIYNYKELAIQHLKHIQLKTSSDTEILLELFVLFGPKILSELIGMFSFAIYDLKTQCLFAARDRFGVKPLFIYHENDTLILCSEIKTIWNCGIEKTPNQHTWSAYFSSGSYGQVNQSFWQHIDQLPGGNYLQYNFATQKLSTTTWYNIADQEESTIALAPKLQADWQKTYFDLLHDAMQLRFRSDVPVGLNLSGGLDSSLLFKIIEQVYKKPENLQAFSFYCNNNLYDELPWVSELLKDSKMNLNAILLKPEEVPNLAKTVAIHQDEPFGGIPTLAYSKCFKTAASLGVKVILDGQGIDEAWAGYDYYQKNTDQLVQGTSSPITIPTILTPEFAQLTEHSNYKQPFNNQLLNLQYRDIVATKIPRALRFNDRISMMHSVELREPFLDHRLVEMAFYAPREYKISQGQSKFLLRHTLKNIMGSKLALAPKRPVQTPQREWLRGELSDWVEDLIATLPGKTNGWFNQKEIKKTWEKYKTGQGDNSFFIWQWINTALIFE